MKLILSWITFLIVLGLGFYLHFKAIGLGIVYYSIVTLMLVLTFTSFSLMDIDYLRDLRDNFELRMKLKQNDPKWHDFIKNSYKINRLAKVSGDIDSSMIPPV